MHIKVCLYHCTSNIAFCFLLEMESNEKFPFRMRALFPDTHPPTPLARQFHPPPLNSGT